MRIIPLRELPLSDDFMFDKVMRNKEVCKRFLESLLRVSIERVEFSQKQDDVPGDYAWHGIRLTAYVNGLEKTVYNVELLTSSKKNLEKRARFDQGSIDRRFIEKGEDCEKLPINFIIFVCSFDYYGEGLPVYEKTCFISPYLKYRQYIDGSHVLILNSQYDRDGEYTRDCASPEILEFLDLLDTHEDVDVNTLEHDFTKTVAQSVYDIRTSKTMEAPYMAWLIKDAKAMAVKLLKSNILTVKNIADFVDLPVDVVLALKAEIGNKQP